MTAKQKAYVVAALALGLVAVAMRQNGIAYWPIALGSGLVMLLAARRK